MRFTSTIAGIPDFGGPANDRGGQSLRTTCKSTDHSAQSLILIFFSANEKEEGRLRDFSLSFFEHSCLRDWDFNAYDNGNRHCPDRS